MDVPENTNERPIFIYIFALILTNVSKYGSTYMEFLFAMISTNISKWTMLERRVRR